MAVVTIACKAHCPPLASCRSPSTDSGDVVFNNIRPEIFKRSVPIVTRRNDDKQDEETLSPTMENNPNMVDGHALDLHLHALEQHHVFYDEFGFDNYLGGPFPEHVQHVAPLYQLAMPPPIQTLRILDDPAAAHFAQIDSNSAADLSLALSHTEALTRVIVDPYSHTPEQIDALLNSTIILSKAFVNASALLNVLVNRTNPLAFILHLPQDVMGNILFYLADTAPPDCRRWKGSTLGWVSLYWTCTDIRRVMRNNAPFWAAVCTQLPRAHLELRALASDEPLTMMISKNFPAMDIAFGRGSSSDTRRMLNLVGLTNAHRFCSISSTGLRICASAVLKWMATTGSRSPLGLPCLQRLDIEAPLQFVVKDCNRPTIAKYVRRPFNNIALVTPILRDVKFKNVCYPFQSPAMQSLHIEFDHGRPSPDCPRPTLSHIIGLLVRSQHIVRKVCLFNAIDEEEDDHIAAPLDLPALETLTVAYSDLALVHLSISRLRLPVDCNINVNVQFKQSDAIVSQMTDLFIRLLFGQPHRQQRMLRVRHIGTYRTYTRTELTWTFDLDDVYRVSDCKSATRTIVLQTPLQVTWLTCLRVFAETLVLLGHPHIKSLVLPSSSKAWEIKAFHELNTEIVRALFTIGAVDFVWPTTRVSWALGTNAAWAVPNGYPSILNVPFAQYLEDMRNVQTFDIDRL